MVTGLTSAPSRFGPQNSALDVAHTFGQGVHVRV